MAGAPFRVRNKRGELIDAPQYTASEAKHKFGQVLDTALRTGPVAIIKQRKPTAVLISLEDYRALTEAGDRSLALLTAEFDRRFDVMQAEGAAAAMQRAFDTPPAQLGAYAAASLQDPARVTRKAAAKRRTRTKRG
ncbi:MAG TPA: type II toxin-antitoxin system prevent-host-death family antitoxin [Casimicrobiaceae bacterium]|nr:type II toxin-antitoxin system prevent-host-death family antitoxin [Casimicrobiaceae bacterium]